jgi:hypothetical protein
MQQMSAIHHKIEAGLIKPLEVVANVPTFCKVEVKGKHGPCIIQIKYHDETSSVTAFASLTQDCPDS